MENDGSEQMDLGVVHVTHTGLDWSRASGSFPTSRNSLQCGTQGETSDYHINSAEKSDVLTGLRVLVQALAGSCTGRTKGSILLPQIVCQSDELHNVFRYECWRCLVLLWIE